MCFELYLFTMHLWTGKQMLDMIGFWLSESMNEWQDIYPNDRYGRYQDITEIIRKSFLKPKEKIPPITAVRLIKNPIFEQAYE